MPIEKILRPILVSLVLAALTSTSLAAGDKPLTFADLMKLRTIEGPVISEDGRWIAYGLAPDRGDGEAVVRRTDGGAEHRIERGAQPRISADSRWAAVAIVPTLEEREKAEKGKKKNGDKKGDDEDKPKNGLAVIALDDGSEVLRADKVESFAFSEDGRWLAYKLYREKKEKEEGETEAKEEEGEKDDKKEDEKKLGSPLKLRRLSTGEETAYDDVAEYAFDEPSAFLAYAVSAPEGEANGVYVRELAGGAGRTLRRADKGRFTHLTWLESHGDESMSLLAFVAAPTDDEGEPGDAEVWVWEGKGDPRRAASRDDAPEGWTVPSANELHWSRDGRRLFFGFKPADQDEDDEDDDGDDEEEAFDPYDLEALVNEREVDVWHWNDPLIVTHQKESWDEEKDRVYRAVFHRDSGRVVALADLEMRQVEPPENPRFALGKADAPYLKELTWDGPFADLYAVDLANGERHLVRRRLRGDFTASLSPGGRFVVFYDNDADGDDSDGQWYLYDVERRETVSVTSGLGVPMADEDHDYPSPAPDYKMAEWLADESAVLIYDKYDVWRIPVDGGRPVNLTGGRGREQGYRFRVVDLDRDEEALDPAAPLLLTAFHERLKHDGFYTARTDRAGVTKLLESGEHRLRVVAKARDAARLLFTRESYTEFPDLWTAELLEAGGLVALGEPRKLSDANPGISEFAWGEAELVEWSSADGVPLQGALIKPGNYEPGKRYPVLVYFYRFFSQRVREFNEPAVNHRPSFPLYASNGYAVFLPDVRFEVGRPGFAATKSLVPGVQKLIDMGIADPDAIGLHGHSWSGYQTAFVITQTRIFKAAVAGAPVSNMTSAYSGIRWGSGRARQFQYEMSQSRIGGSLWEYPERYVENSPVFFADRIETPLLIQFGDKDEAVPWYQGIELYLAMRRLGKDCVFLEYRGEPHHLQKYANKLDYSIKMKEFFDHHLKGAPAPKWMTEGVAYRGE